MESWSSFEAKYIFYFNSFCNIKQNYVLVAIGWDIEIKNMKDCYMYYIVSCPK